MSRAARIAWLAVGYLGLLAAALTFGLGLVRISQYAGGLDGAGLAFDAAIGLAAVVLLAVGVPRVRHDRARGRAAVAAGLALTVVALLLTAG